MAELEKQASRIEDLEQAGARVEQFKALIPFKEQLKATRGTGNDSEIYNLLRGRRSKLVSSVITAELAQRPSAEGFLTSQIEQEQDPDMQVTALQLLGHLRSPLARLAALKFLAHEHDRHREVALFVLGWVGEEEDIKVLNRHMLEETSQLLRITAASALRQIFFRNPALKDALLESLRAGFMNEKDDEVLKWIIVMIESVATKKLGLREDKEDPDLVHGDLEKAREKTMQYFASGK